ncbi:2,3-diaminopropionate biosynthesis protein SbnA [Bacillus atrophaeus]|uniref:2,3-diaminopropionate biosynthesis protein SbnA n=1 Tax=Bacillus atrophaeus TaxID=1452 RepID=UPI00228137EB|nr:2,3-diaminopropionate biosynthesis protein SbnA [Bacillus atrophaeus]MCY8499318.1 2,3-diaminopropionate biosynthesis protein SbnA [Bacillus atrophaeus]MCY8814952.1 2,3-diaminopropionate biosynthesis protein SbnA [Bacillus atrophaeus]MCY8823185.1 2,3-diaminopropionate biosynthesis protein SbnA [Bacillus atrophaeus]MCY8831164.1 2,3-diaminopropionate biosynthesis protein SbnA [Bacillus atrophaeus]MCY8834843.1 2,3-diaminopropionate biosynthesis protein SbnA [Bacillus atrophaeus]
MEVKGILGAIGNTPLIKLENVFKEKRFSLFLKMEGMNPGGSAKDRSAYSMIMNAIKEGKITKDTVIIESSSGNLAIALAQICCYLHLRLICVIDAKTTTQNIKLIKAYGAEIVCITEPDPVTNEFLKARIDKVNQLLQEIPNSYRPNQYTNINNPKGHQIVIKEISEQLNKNIDYLFCAASTCGTLRGYVEYIRMNQLKTEVIAVDAVGSVIFGDTRKKRLIPGLGAAVVPGLFQEDLANRYIHVSDLDCVKGCRKLLYSEAILAGGSTGANLSAIMKMEKEIPDNSTCVMVMHDNGERYLETIYSDEWVQEHFGDIAL